MSNLSDIVFEHINEKYAYGAYGDFKVIMMKKNSYINATKLCDEHKKLFKNWSRNMQNEELINEVKKEINYSKLSTTEDIDPIITIKGGNKKLQIVTGTYVHPLLMPDIIKWIQIPRSKQLEYDVQQKLNKKFNGECEVPTELGIIDILTDTQIIEIKNFKDWKSALGQILIYSTFYPEHKKCIHLFKTRNDKILLKKIEDVYKKYDVHLTYE